LHLLQGNCQRIAEIERTREKDRNIGTKKGDGYIGALRAGKDEAGKHWVARAVAVINAMLAGV
jgi:hypothetical protein